MNQIANARIYKSENGKYRAWVDDEEGNSSAKSFDTFEQAAKWLAEYTDKSNGNNEQK